MADTTKSIIKRKKGKGSKFDPAFIEIAATMMSSGMSEEDVRKELDVMPQVIKRWREDFDTFDLAFNDPNQALIQILTQKTMEAATGYEFDEITNYYVTRTETDKKGKEKEVLKLDRRVVKTKRQPANPELLKFLLINKADYKDHKSETTNRTLSVSLESGGVEALINQMGSGYLDDFSKKRKAVENEHEDI